MHVLSSLVEKDTELALAEGSAHEHVGNDVDVVVLHDELLVDSEVSEAKLVEVDKARLDLGVSLGVGLLVVELLGALGVDGDAADLEQVTGLLGSCGRLVNNHDFLGHGSGGGSGGLAEDDASIKHLFVVGFEDHGVLGDHLDLRGLSGRLHKIALEVLVLNGLGRLDAKDVTADLVAELDPASLHTEECNVATLLSWGLAHDRNLESLTGINRVLKGDHLSGDVIARGLKELGSSRPGSLTVIAHPPGLAEDLANVDAVLVREALLDETSGVTHLLGRGGLSLPRMVRGVRGLRGSS